jgi:TFIIF-interacting CTD phosphatase-like protein
LALVDEDPKRVVLVDNNPASFVLCPANGIPVPSFYDDPADRGLEQALQVQQKPTPPLQDGTIKTAPRSSDFYCC